MRKTKFIIKNSDYYQRKYPLLRRPYNNFENRFPIFCRDITPFAILFNNVKIWQNDQYIYIFYDERDKDDANSLMDFLSYIFHQPTFIFTNNARLNGFLENLYNSYQHFDEFGFVNNLKSKDEIVCLKQITDPILLALYNTAMKQPEPLAQCVFLFRIIEFYHEKIIRKSMRIEQCIEDLYEKALKNKFIPLDKIPLFDSGPKINMISYWKRKCKPIVDKWQQSGSTIGKKIYSDGRCGIAHGRTRNPIIYHDYANDYKFIKEINVILELVTRYIIELRNPEFKDYIKIRNRNFEHHFTRNPKIVGRDR